MTVLVPNYVHRTGEHCASTSLRNILDFHGVGMSEAMIVGLAGGLGFLYLRSDSFSPTRIFHGRTATLEQDFADNAGIPFVDRQDDDSDHAWEILRSRLSGGEPVMISTDTFYLRYHNTSSHFPGHRAVAVGYDDENRDVLIADRKFEELQRCSFEDLRQARQSDDYPMGCQNQYGDFLAERKPERTLAEAARIALRRQSASMLTPDTNTLSGVGAMRALSADFESWSELEDWSWASRFGYQVVIKRGAGGSFFRSMYAEFLDEVGAQTPALAKAELAARMHDIAGMWRQLAAILKEQSERDTCAPELFERAGEKMAELAVAEETFFRASAEVAGDEAVWR